MYVGILHNNINQRFQMHMHQRIELSHYCTVVNSKVGDRL